MADNPPLSSTRPTPATSATWATNRQVVGPNTLGEYLVAVTADYDPWWGPTGRTRVGFAYKYEVDRLAAATPAGPR